MAEINKKMDDEMKAIHKWAEQHKKRRKKTKNFPVKIIIGGIILLIIVVLVWLYANHATSKKESGKEVYVNLDTGEEIDLDAEKEAGTTIVWEDER